MMLRVHFPMPSDTRPVVRWRSSSVRAHPQTFGSHPGVPSFPPRRHLQAHREVQLGPVQLIYTNLNGRVSNRVCVA